MIRDLVSALDYSICAEIALAMFVGSFAVMLYGTFRLSNNATEHFASIPLSGDATQDPQVDDAPRTLSIDGEDRRQ